MSPAPGRRQILKAAAGAATALAGSILRARSGVSSRRPREVLVIGAGLAGLCAAYELEQRGCRVTLLEAEPTYVGGRVRTLRFGGDLYGETGAMRIPASHHLVRHYTRQFGLPLRRFIEMDPDAFYFVRGQRRRIRSVRHLDPRFAIQASGQPGASIWNEEFHEIAGGMDLLPRAFLQRLRSAPLMGRPVVRIVQPGTGRAAVVFEEDGRRRRLEADFVLCTVPLPLLDRIAITPALPPSRQRDRQRIDYGHASKTLVVTGRRFWESDDGIYGGASYTDLPTGMTYYPSDNAEAHNPRISARPGVLLASYTLGPAALRLSELTSDECSHLVQRTVALLHPQLKQSGMVLHAQSWSWDLHPWSRGAFAAPGQDPELIRRIRSPHGLLHFAGEHTSMHATWMEGALESALRAVTEITGS